MRKSIYKFHLETRVRMPRSAEILSVQLQHGKPVIWAEVSIPDVADDRYFLILGTGFSVPDDCQYVGTYQENGGDLVWHVYDLGYEGERRLKKLGLGEL